MSGIPRIAVLGTLLLACAGSWTPPVPGLVSDGRLSMGTVFEIQLVTRRASRARAQIDEAFAETAELEALFSRYQAESDVSRLNRKAGLAATSLDPRTVELLERAIDFARLTGGTFDVTIGPLVELWTEAAKRNRLPDPVELERARSLVGAGRIRIEDSSSVTLPQRGMSVDLGGIAKGHTLDLLVPVFRAQGFDRTLLSFGQSSVWALGAPPGSDGWRLLLRGTTGDLEGVLTLRDRALSVSSTLGRSSEISGRRYGHVIDPRSGQALTRRVQAAVVAESAALAEALSTALLILEPERGLALVEAQPDTEARLVDESGRVTQTRGWQRACHFETLGATPP